jgi:nucleotide-binding universal stress UspA family protein
MYRSLLVPLDGSPLAEHALPLARSLAVRAGAQLQLLYVQHPLEAEYSQYHSLTAESWMQELTTRQEAYLDGLARRLRAGGAPSIAPLLLPGEVAGTIHKQAVDSLVDLVVMTTHARGPVARLWLGSVTDQLLRELPKPLLLVRPSAKQADLTDEVVLKHVLLPLDGTPLAEQILAPATALGELVGADYTLLRVVRPVAPVHYPPEGAITGPWPEGLRQQVERVETEARRQAQDYLDEVA